MITESETPSGAEPARNVGPALRRRSDRGPLVAGVVLLGIGAIMLLRQLDLFGQVAFCLIPVAMFAALAVLAFAGFQKNPATRFGLLIPAGLSVSIAILIGGHGFGILPQALVPLLFFAGPGAAFVAIWLLDPRRRWALLSAWACALIGFTAFVASLGRVGDIFAPLVFLGGLSACFVWHFLRTDREWALLPAGFLMAAGLVSMTDELRLREPIQMGLFFFGCAATFAAYYLLGRPPKVKWAAIPALAFATLGFLALFARPLVSFGAPVVLIGFGLYLILRPPTGTTPAPPIGRPPAAPDPDPTDSAGAPVGVSGENGARE